MPSAGPLHRCAVPLPHLPRLKAGVDRDDDSYAASEGGIASTA